MQENNRKSMLLPLLLVGIMFFVIGFGVGISGFLIPALKSAFSLSTGESYLVTFAIFSAFVVFGQPAGWLVVKLGYKKSIFIAFLVMALGMWVFIPSAGLNSFPLFLLALFVGGAGNTLLQTAVNPYVTILGPSESAAMRLCLMGIMNKLAWWMAPLFLGLFVDLQNVNIEAISLPFYIVVGILLLLASVTFFMPLPEVKAKGEDDTVSANKGNNASLKNSIWQYPHLWLGVIAIFLYVGIETLPMASAIDFARAAFGDVANLQQYSRYATFGLVAGYLFGVVAIPKLISQTKALVLFSVLGIVGSLVMMWAPVKLAFYAILLLSFANSIMWPAIWPLAIADLGRYTKKGASMLVMGIVGGAVIPLIFGLLVDVFKADAPITTPQHYQMAYIVLLPCYLYILYYGLWGNKIRR